MFQRLRTLPLRICGLLAGLMGLLLALSACDEAPGTTSIDVNGTPVPMAGAASSRAPNNNAQSALFYAGQTQMAASLELTQAAAEATHVAQQTLEVVQHTQTQVALEMTVARAHRDAAATQAAGTATSAWAIQQDSWTAVAVTLTSAGAVTQAAATAVAMTETHLTEVAVADLTAQARAAESMHAATATAVQAGLNTQTQEVRLWGPYILLVLFVVLIVFLVLRWSRILEARQRVIAQPNGAPLIIAEQRRSLEAYLPNFLRWLAILLETNQVIIDPERHPGPVTIISGGSAETRQFAEPAMQERVTRRRQFGEAVAALSGGVDDEDDPPPIRRGVRSAEPPTPLSAADWGHYEVINPGQVSGWLSEVREQLPPGDDDTTLTIN